MDVLQVSAGLLLMRRPVNLYDLQTTPAVLGVLLLMPW
jgi:hypothetical protein